MTDNELFQQFVQWYLIIGATFIVELILLFVIFKPFIIQSEPSNPSWIDTKGNRHLDG